MEDHTLDLSENLTSSSFENGLETSFCEDEVNLLCLWYVSGNDWTWMLQEEIGNSDLVCLTNPRHHKRYHRRSNQMRLLLTSSLTALVLWLYTSTRFASNFTQHHLLKPNVADSKQLISPKSCSEPIDADCLEQNASSKTDGHNRAGVSC